MSWSLTPIIINGKMACFVAEICIPFPLTATDLQDEQHPTPNNQHNVFPLTPRKNEEKKDSMERHYSDVTCKLGHLKSPTIQLFVPIHSLFRLTLKETSQLCITVTWWGEFKFKFKIKCFYWRKYPVTHSTIMRLEPMRVYLPHYFMVYHSIENIQTSVERAG